MVGYGVIRARMQHQTGLSDAMVHAVLPRLCAHAVARAYGRRWLELAARQMAVRLVMQK
jgi:hypothetical protein